MKVEYIISNRIEVKEAELFRIGNSLVLEIKGSKLTHRIILQESQWKLLAQSAMDRAAGSY
jgi:hypothetical protein